MTDLTNKKIEWTEDQKEESKKILFKFESFCENFLKIEDMNGDIVPFKLLSTQRRFINEILEQWDKINLIKVVIVKARKMGFTTVICAFIFWILYSNVTDRDTRRAITGTHKEDSNPVLLRIIRTFHNNLSKRMQLPIGKNNESLIEFMHVNPYNKDEMMIGAIYETKVVSNVEKVGRGPTSQMLHVSELAHIDNSYGLAASILSVVGNNIIDSMVFLESTAKGTDNYHYEVFMDAINGKVGNKFLPFFAAWHEDERYVEKTSDNFILDEEELIEKTRYNLTDEQMMWRRSMLSSFKGTEKQKMALFRQEYPANYDEAFQFSKIDSYLEAGLIIDALNRPQQNQSAETAVVAAFDPSNKGIDDDVFMIRHGNNLFGLELPRFGDDVDARVRFLQDKLNNKVLNIDMLFIDAGGGGYQIYSFLKNRGHSSRISLIEFGAAADNKLKAKFKRDEMFVEFNEALNDKHEPLSIKVSDQMRNAYIADLTATGYILDSNNRPKMESKDKVRVRLRNSTGMTDATVMLWAMPVWKRAAMQYVSGNIPKARSGYSAF